MDHRTAVFANPVTVAVKESDWPCAIVADEGEMAIDTASCCMLTTADALTVVSATLVATTWNVPNLFGAVYTPELVIDPPNEPSCTDHVTAVLAVPVTVAE